MNNTEEYRRKFYQTFANMFGISSEQVEEFAKWAKDQNPFKLAPREKILRRHKRQRMCEKKNRRKHRRKEKKT